MANYEQVHRLKQGVNNWNAWRKEHPTESINLRDADLRDADLSKADLRDADLNYAKLNSTDLSKANLSKANLSKADLSGANLISANLNYAKLSHTDLSIAKLSFSDLSKAKFISANLSHARLNNTDLSRADLNNANLNNADLSKANLSDANLRDTNFTNVIMENTLLGDCDLRIIKGLETVQHFGPSPLSINTIYQSQGDIPEAFVRGTGAPDSFLEYMKALASKPIEYYTCFISYSSQDEAFAKRLYADLQSNNVRCWFAPHDMRIGDEIRSRIDESIRIHDKLLLVISQHAIESTWVKKEVETAFEKEQQQGKLVLFPVKLDDTVMQTQKAWAADIRRMRHIGDFQHWKEHDSYQQAFTRLLRDLKAESRS